MAYNHNSLKVILSLKTANQIINEGFKIAREYNINPLAIVVLDSGGHQISSQREDGAGIIRIEISIAKSYGALGMGSSSRGIGIGLSKKPVFATALSSISGGKFATAAGGVLILDDKKQVIGAVGVSGDTSERDEFVAISAIKSVGFLCDPEKPDDDWDK
ncbi:MAG: hypothetical protein CBC38_01340 [Gammaproteobacteria bacterium TMED78]|nr:MAG: hypothetical protein CBC38_01340 [Gammaproteobacteria bacterium TMED78]|tara:strand:- start:29689 stop:30168 length:480 start_codon:yes stop_codon:yes gene_type:complete